MARNYLAIYSDSNLTNETSFEWSELIRSFESWDTFNGQPPIIATRNPIEFIAVDDADVPPSLVSQKFLQLDSGANITWFSEYTNFWDDWEVWDMAYNTAYGDDSDYHSQSPFTNYYFVDAPIDLVKREIELANAFGAKATFVEGTVLTGMPIYCMRLTLWTGDQYYPASKRYQISSELAGTTYGYQFTYLYE